jgi:hypothetical protein
MTFDHPAASPGDDVARQSGNRARRRWTRGIQQVGQVGEVQVTGSGLQCEITGSPCRQDIGLVLVANHEGEQWIGGVPRLEMSPERVLLLDVPDVRRTDLGEEE